jgi:hypothetical protein
MALAEFTFTSRARPVIEIAVGDVRTAVGTARWDTARWDNPAATWAGDNPDWLDVTCHGMRFTCEYGRQRTTDRFIPGVATVIVTNATGWADPDTVDEPGVLSMRPGRAIRLGVVHAVYGYRCLFRGFIDAIVPMYDADELDVVQLDCVDALAEVNRAKLKPISSPSYAGESASARTTRILDLAQWSASARDIRPSSELLTASDMGGQVADLLGQVADSAGGSVFGDLEGRVAFRPRDWQTFPPGTPPDGTIGNVAPGDVCPTRWERPFARADITTRAIVGRDPATAVVADDPDGIAKYGIEPFERTDLLTQSDNSVSLLALRALRTRSWSTAPRVRSVSLDAATAAAALDLMSTVDVYRPSRYRCRLTYPPPRGPVFDAEYFATGVSHEVTPSSWTLELNLDVAAPYVAVGGRWDQAQWDLALWATPVLQSAEALV